MTLALVLSGAAVFISGLTFLLVLVLLGRKEFGYATKRDLAEVLIRLTQVGGNQSRLYRYLEAIDGHLGANGHRVLLRRVSSSDAPARER